jgi:hypothetical protein
MKVIQHEIIVEWQGWKKKRACINSCSFAFENHLISEPSNFLSQSKLYFQYLEKSAELAQFE